MNQTTLKQILFTLVLIGFTFLSIAILTTNIYLLGLAELSTIPASIYLIKINLTQ